MTTTDRHPRRWWILGVLCLALLTVALDNTIVNVALPSLAAGLDASTADLLWIVNAYPLTMAGLLISAGGLADRYGRKLMLVIGLALFGAGSLGAALAAEPWQVTATRVVMGLGAVFLMPCTLAVLVLVFDEEERPWAIGIWAAVSSAGLALGPVLGGFLLEHYWWGAVFLVNVPVAIVGLVGVVLLVPESRDPADNRVDLVGAALSTVAMVAVVWTVTTGVERGWGSPHAVTGIVVTLAGLAAFAVWVRTAERPIVDPSMFADRRFRSAATAGVLAAFGMGGSLFLLTQDLQQVYGYGPLEAGLRLAPLAVAVMVSSSLISAHVSKRLGQAATIAAGLAVAAAGLLVIALAPDTSGLSALVGLVLVGLGVGTAIPVTAHVLMSTIPPARAASGSGVNGTLQELGSALGVAVLGSVLVARFAAGLPGGLGSGAERSLAAATEAAAGRPDVVRQVHDAFAAAMSVSQVVGGLAVLLGGVAAGVLLHWAQRRASAAQPPIEESSRV